MKRLIIIMLTMALMPLDMHASMRRFTAKATVAIQTAIVKAAPTFNAMPLNSNIMDTNVTTSSTNRLSVDLQVPHNTIKKVSPEILQTFQHIQHTHGPAYSPNVPLSYSDESSHKDIALYHAETQSITIGQNFCNVIPTFQLHTLLHEYRHHLQRINGVLVTLLELATEQNTKSALDKAAILRKNFYAPEMLNAAQKQTGKITYMIRTCPETWKIYEHDADHFAAQHISCPTCLRMLYTGASTTKNLQGYFIQTDYEPFLHATMHNPTCPAHSLKSDDHAHNIIVTQLNAALDEYLINPSGDLALKLMDLDKKSGDLLQHLCIHHYDLTRPTALN